MKKEIKGLFYGVIFCIIIDAICVVIGIYHESPVSDYILMSILLPIVNFLFLVLVSFTFGNYSQLPDSVDDEEQPKLK